MERKVKIYRQENDSFIELWRLVDCPQRYVGRYTGGPGEWVKICDPLGYCEMDYTYPPDDVFIVCDQKGNELFRSRNGDGSAHFKKLEQEARDQMAEYLKDHDIGIVVANPHAQYFAHWVSGAPVGRFEDWLCSFQDPDLYPEANDYPENWIYYDVEEIGGECLKRFTHLGTEYEIERVDYKHKYCGKTFSYVYAAGYYIGAIWDHSTIGTMYTKHQAAKILTEAIRKNFPDRYVISAVETYKGYGDDKGFSAQKNYKIEHAWEVLAKNDLHRKYIDAMAAEEAEYSHFFGDYEDIRKEYPDCIRSYHYPD